MPCVRSASFASAAAGTCSTGASRRRASSAAAAGSSAGTVISWRCAARPAQAWRPRPNEGRPTTQIQIGQGARISHAIVDKNARIGDDVTISPEGKPADFDGPNFYVRDGLVVIPKGAVVMSGTTI